MSKSVLHLYSRTVAEGVKILEERVEKLEAENKRLTNRLRSQGRAKVELRRRLRGLA